MTEKENIKKAYKKISETYTSYVLLSSFINPTISLGIVTYCIYKKWL